MGFRFYRRLHIAPGLAVNLSRSGPSLSVGVRGAHLTVGRRGVTRTLGLPGTGIFYTSRVGLHSGVHSASAPRPLPSDEQLAADRRFERTAIAMLIVLIVIAVGLSLG